MAIKLFDNEEDRATNPDYIYVGELQVQAVYVGSVRVWPEYSEH